MGHSLNRRAAILGAVISAGALALPVAAAVKPTTLEALAEKFRLDAMALDPTITKAWFGYDEIMKGPQADRVMSVYFERATAPLVRKPKRTDDITAEWWREFDTLTKSDKVRYAQILRDTNPAFNELADAIERYYV